jgi:hypothetical protein
VRDLYVARVDHGEGHDEGLLVQGDLAGHVSLELDVGHIRKVADVGDVRAS